MTTQKQTLYNKPRIAFWKETLTEKQGREFSWEVALLFRDAYTPMAAARKSEQIIHGRKLLPKKEVVLREKVFEICQKYDKNVKKEDIFEDVNL